MNCEQIIGNGALGEATSRLLRSEDLTETDAAEFLQALLEPDASDAQIAFALSAMAAKGETADELAGMAAAMRARAVPLPTHHRQRTLRLRLPNRNHVGGNAFGNRAPLG